MALIAKKAVCPPASTDDCRSPHFSRPAINHRGLSPQTGIGADHYFLVVSFFSTFI